MLDTDYYILNTIYLLDKRVGGYHFYSEEISNMRRDEAECDWFSGV